MGEGWITDLSQIRKLAPYADDKKAQQEFLKIKHQNKVRLAKYIKEHNGIDVDPDSIFDVQVKRLHEYKRQLLNILHVMYLYNEIKEHPDMEFVPRTFIFGAKAAAGYKNAKLTIKLINSVAEVINNDKSIITRSKWYLSRTTKFPMQSGSLQQQMSASRSQLQVKRHPVPVI